jgi:hypothetical protein
VITVPAPVGLGRDTARRRAAREALVKVLWGPRGARRLPTERELVRAMTACDPRDVWWVCEMSSAGPVYLLPTREWVRELAKYLRTLGAARVLEVAAGDGFLTRCLRATRPRYALVATDDASWAKPAARMSERDREEFHAVPVEGLRVGRNVEALSAKRAVKAYAPDVVLVSWGPPGPLVETMIRAKVKYVVEVGVEGDVCGDVARTWRYQKEFLDGPLEARALCRLDARPKEPRATRVTLYYGRAHAEYGVDQ